MLEHRAPTKHNSSDGRAADCDPANLGSNIAVSGSSRDLFQRVNCCKMSIPTPEEDRFQKNIQRPLFGTILDYEAGDQGDADEISIENGEQN